MKKIQFAMVWFLVCLLPACIMPAPIARTVTPVIAQPLEMIAVSMYVENDASSLPELKAGSTAVVLLDFQPSLVQVQRDENGKVLSTSWLPWDDHPAAEMRTCFSMLAPCQPGGDWLPYVSRLSFQVPVDWLGTREAHAAVQFRDRDGSPVQAGSPDTVGSSAAQPDGPHALTLSMISRQDLDLSVETLSPSLQTALAVTQAAFPVTGSILIEDGRCCAGGKANTSIDLQVRFAAESPAGQVIEMRVQPGGSCLLEDSALEADWEAFTPLKILSTNLALNWVGFYVNVQYRDSAGNQSPVYCDDISLEGSP
jgi:hypothetical protein